MPLRQPNALACSFVLECARRRPPPAGSTTSTSTSTFSTSTTTFSPSLRYGPRTYWTIAQQKLNHVAPIKAVRKNNANPTLILPPDPPLRGATLKKITEWQKDLAPRTFAHTSKAVTDHHLLCAARHLRLIDLMVQGAASRLPLDAVAAALKRIRRFLWGRLASAGATEPLLVVRVERGDAAARAGYGMPLVPEEAAAEEAARVGWRRRRRRVRRCASAALRRQR